MNNFGAIPHSVSSYNSQWVDRAEDVVGYVYVTNDKMPNPWDTLTKYSRQLARDLR
jgi:hypothetical protein